MSFVLERKDSIQAPRGPLFPEYGNNFNDSFKDTYFKKDYEKKVEKVLIKAGELLANINEEEANEREIKNTLWSLNDCVGRVTEAKNEKAKEYIAIFNDMLGY